MQVFLTVQMSKQLIADAIVKHPAVQQALKEARIVLTCGTTNAYIAHTLLCSIGDAEGFDPKEFYRGIIRPYGVVSSSKASQGEVVIEHGKWNRALSGADVAQSLKKGDVILKGANALDAQRGEAALLIGHPQGGTVSWVLPAVIGRRVKLLIPVGLEKRVFGPLSQLVRAEDEPESTGMRMVMLPGEVFTELDAVRQLFGLNADLIAAGGVQGAEGAICLSLSGESEAFERAGRYFESIRTLPGFIS